MSFHNLTCASCRTREKCSEIDRKQPVENVTVDFIGWGLFFLLSGNVTSLSQQRELDFTPTLPSIGTFFHFIITWNWPTEMGSTHYNSNGHDDMYDTNFTADISNRMQVPKCIRIGGILSNIGALLSFNFLVSFYLKGTVPMGTPWSMEIMVLSMTTRQAENLKWEFLTEFLLLVICKKLFSYICLFIYSLNNFTMCYFAGQDKHVGMKAPPQELILENSILTTDFPSVRVKVIWL